MAKRKKGNLFDTLKSERYLVWAIVAAVTVAIGLLGRISISNSQSDTEVSDAQNLVTGHVLKTPAAHQK
jgi:hypothetical protein